MITTSASTITARLDLVVAQARRADALAHKYEKRRSASQTLALHGANFFDRSASVHQARQAIGNEAERVRELGSSLTNKMSFLKASVADVESGVAKIRVLLEQAVTTAVEGDIAEGETLTASATNALKAAIDIVEGLCSTSDNARQVWVELSVECWAIP